MVAADAVVSSVLALGDFLKIDAGDFGLFGEVRPKKLGAFKIGVVSFFAFPVEGRAPSKNPNSDNLF